MVKSCVFRHWCLLSLSLRLQYMFYIHHKLHLIFVRHQHLNEKLSLKARERRLYPNLERGRKFDQPASVVYEQIDKAGLWMPALAFFPLAADCWIYVVGHDKAVKQLSFLSVSAACHISSVTCNSPMQQARASAMANPALSLLPLTSVTQRQPDLTHRLFPLEARDESKTETAGKCQNWYMSERWVELRRGKVREGEGWWM